MTNRGGDGSGKKQAAVAVVSRYRSSTKPKAPPIKPASRRAEKTEEAAGRGCERNDSKSSNQCLHGWRKSLLGSSPVGGGRAEKWQHARHLSSAKLFMEKMLMTNLSPSQGENRSGRGGAASVCAARGREIASPDSHCECHGGDKTLEVAIIKGEMKRIGNHRCTCLSRRPEPKLNG